MIKLVPDVRPEISEVRIPIVESGEKIRSDVARFRQNASDHLGFLRLCFRKKILAAKNFVVVSFKAVLFGHFDLSFGECDRASIDRMF